MIEKVLVTNFKSHAQTEIELGRVTALVGPNGSGKTSLLQAVYVLNHFLRQEVPAAMWDWNSILQFTRKGQSKDSIGITVIGPARSWSVKFLGSMVRDYQAQQNFISSELLELFGQVEYFKAIAQSISAPSYTLDIPPMISVEGSNAASVISYLKTSQEEVHKRIEDDLKEIVPSVKRIRVHPVPQAIKEKRTITANGNTIAYDEDRQVVAQELIFDTKSGDGLPASLVSEGTLVALALLTLLHTSDASLFLLDDVEQGLHPLAQRQLIKTLKEFAEKHDKQILLTSHSGYIIDELAAEDVWVMALDNEGVSRCRRLSDHPDAARLLEVLTTGELQGAVGEDWVVETNSAPEVVNA